MIYKNKKNEKNTGMSPAAAVLTGAVIGAGVAVAGVATLRDKKNRMKAKKVLNQVTDQAKGYIKKLEEKGKAVRKEAESTVDKKKKVVKKAATSAVKKTVS